MPELTGRDLDRAVTEKVMGRRTHVDGSGCSYFQDTDEIWEVIPEYSTDIAAAWQVVERLIELGDHPMLMQSDTGRWALARASSGPVQDGKTDPRVWTLMFDPEDWQDTAPLAICHAALRDWGQNYAD